MGASGCRSMMLMAFSQRRQREPCPTRSVREAAQRIRRVGKFTSGPIPGVLRVHVVAPFSRPMSDYRDDFQNLVSTFHLRFDVAPTTGDLEEPVVGHIMVAPHGKRYTTLFEFAPHAERLDLIVKSGYFLKSFHRDTSSARPPPEGTTRRRSRLRSNPASVPCWPRLVLLFVPELLGLGEILFRFGLLALRLVGQSPVRIRLGIFRVQLDDLGEIGNRFVMFAL